MASVVKQKKCRVCGERFTPWTTIASCCSTKCAIVFVRESAPERKERQQARVEAERQKLARAELREKRQEIKSRKDWLREAQAVCNAMIRERDHTQPCISCGDRYGPFDAGHYRSVGAAPELRFELANIHKQCKACNSNTRRGGQYVMPVERAISVREAYRARLVERIGLAQVEWLESYHEPLRPSVAWLREKIREWRLETRRMREARDKRAA